MLKTPSQRIFWLVLSGFLIITAYFTIWTYNSMLQQAEKSLLLRLEGISNAIALQVDGDLHRQIAAKYPQKDAILYNSQDTDYYKIHRILRSNAEANMLKTPVYTMVFDSAVKHFEFIVTSADSPYYRHIYDTYPKLLYERFTEGGTIPMYSDMYGVWLSAFAPIRDKHGHAVAILMTDERFDSFIQKASTTVINSLMVALFIILPIILLLIYTLRRLIFRESRMKRRLEEAYQTNLKISKELEKSYEKLSSIDKLRKEMIANISHDLRTPLTNLSGYIETLYLRRHDITLPEREKFLNIALKESERLKRLIDDLFELSKLEANQVTLHIEAFPIAELIQDIIAKYDLIGEKKGITIQSSFSENTPWVKADIKLIDRVLQNLMDNAIRYNLKENGKIILTNEVIDKKIFIHVKNTGNVIPPSVIPQLFDRYFKEGNAEGSTGLGLAISKKIINLHACDIFVESRDGFNDFSFGLPVFKNN
jgi:signal transduction histidine kinase